MAYMDWRAVSASISRIGKYLSIIKRKEKSKCLSYATTPEQTKKYMNKK
jgi:hypothetical protein